MDDRVQVKLGDHIDLLAGFPFKSEDFTEGDADIRLLRGANVSQGILKWNQEARFPEHLVGDYKDFLLCADDIVLAMDRPWVEAGLKWSRIRPEDLPLLLVQRVCRLRGSNHLLQQFLAYIVASPSFAAYLKAIVTGVAIPHISSNQIQDFELVLPSLSKQRRICAVLEPLDTLVVNNRRRIELLEETVRLLYREWFVNFRYPGHEDVPLVDSEFGLLPDGWAWLPLSDCPFGLTKPSVEPYEGSKTYLATADVKGLHHVVGGEDMEHSALPSRAQHSPIPNTVWFARMANYQKILFFMDGDPTMDKLVLSSGFACLSCPDPWFGFVAGQVIDSSFEDRKQQFATGATQVSLTDAGARRMPWLVPDEGVVFRFEGLIGPILKTITTLRSVNGTLAETRDLLLPRLVSGALDISDLNLGLEAVS